MVHAGQIDALPPLVTAAVLMADEGDDVTIVATGCAEETRHYIEERGVRCQDLRWKRYPRWVAGKAVLRFVYGWRLFLEMKRTSPEVIWIHSPHAAGYAWIAKLFPRRLLVAQSHEYEDGNGRRRRSQDRLLRMADVFIVPDATRGWLSARQAGRAADWTVIPNRPAADHSQQLAGETSQEALSLFRAHGGNPRCERLVLYQGLLHPNRCLKEAVLAFQGLPADDIGFLILGSGPDEEYVRSLKGFARRDDRIAFVPNIPYPDHHRITAGCICGILFYAPTSINNIFCAPNKIFEYSICGIGVVMSDNPPLARIHREVGLGELCDSTNQDSIRCALQRELNKTEHDRRIAACRFLSATPTTEVLLKQLRRRLEDCLRLSRGRRVAHQS